MIQKPCALSKGVQGIWIDLKLVEMGGKQRQVGICRLFLEIYPAGIEKYADTSAV